MTSLSGDAGTDLAAAYQHCTRLARRSASNFYYAFWLLPRAKRRAMCALYAFMRRTDDLVDNEQPAELRRRALGDWRAALRAALAGGAAPDPVLAALADTVRNYSIPTGYLLDAIDGVEQDLEPAGFADFGQLEEYCYRVASTVGLICIHIWGFRDDRALSPARHCGIAFQLTNILRDLHADALVGRCYLPRDELARFGCTAEQIAGGECSDGWRSLMRFQVERAESYYRRAAELPALLDADGRRVFAAMFRTYAALLRQIKRRDGDLFGRTIRLGRWRKAAILTQSLLDSSPPTFSEVASA